MNHAIERKAAALYAAYGKTTDFKNYQGNLMPEWDALPEKIRAAWMAAASVSEEGRISNETLIRLTGWDRLRALFGRQIRSHVVIDYKVTAGLMETETRSYASVSPIFPQRTAGLTMMLKETT